MFVLLILHILVIKDYVLLHVLKIGMQTLQLDYVFNLQTVQTIHMEILLLRHVLLFALLITMLMFVMIQRCVYKFVHKAGTLMILLNNVSKNVLKLIKLTVLMIQINVFRFVHMVSMPKMIQECVCMIAQMDHLLIIMYEFVLQFVQLLQIFMDNQLIILVFKFVPKIQTFMLIILQDYVLLIAHLVNQLLLIL